jgi:uncharacterized membrane protein YbhN (UPF0104 family)
VASLLVFLAFYWSQAAGWWLLLRGFALRAPFLPVSRVWAASILARYIPGTVFMFVGRAWMHQAQGLDLSRVGAAMVYEQALQLCSALVAVALLWPLASVASGWAGLSLLAIPALLALLHPRVFAPLAGWLLRRVRGQTLGASLGFGTVVAVLWYYVATWLLVGLAAWLFARATLDVGVDALPLVTAAYAFAYVAGMAAFFVPSGVGVREAVLAGALAGEIGAAVALAWAVLLRLWQTGIEVLFAGVVALVARLASAGGTGQGDTQGSDA